MAKYAPERLHSLLIGGAHPYPRVREVFQQRLQSLQKGAEAIVEMWDAPVSSTLRARLRTNDVEACMALTQAWTEATETLATYAAEVAQEPVIITVAGKPVAALVAIENADLETVSLSTNPDFLALIERSRAHHQAEGGLSSAELRRRLGLRNAE